jgi:hypothetical protein
MTKGPDERHAAPHAGSVNRQDDRDQVEARARCRGSALTWKRNEPINESRR